MALEAATTRADLDALRTAATTLLSQIVVEVALLSDESPADVLERVKASLPAGGERMLQ